MATFESEVASTATEAALAGAHPPGVPTRAVASWVMYDLANTIFSMGVVSLYFPTLVRDAVGAGDADRMFGLIMAASMSVIFLVSPLLGAMTDRARRRMPFLITSTLICVFFTVLLARSGFWFAAICFIIANIAYQAGLQFYDALLPEVSTEENRGRIGGMGVGVGYLGSFLAVGLGFIIKDNLPMTFTAVAVLFLLFALPCFLFVRERGNPRPRPINLQMVRESTAETIRTLRSSQQYPGLLRFLVGRVFYTDAINTVISVMVLYTINVAVATGLTEEQGKGQAYLVMMTAISFAVVGGFVWGHLADRIGPRRTLNHVLRAWMGIFTLAALVGILGLPIWALYVVACSAGFALGGIWAADRPYMLRLTPPARIGEFYGLYGMVGRFSAITGPLIWAGMTWLIIQKLRLPPLGGPSATPGIDAVRRAALGQGISVIALLLLVILSYVILQKVSDTPRKWEGADLVRG
ncbi:MAG TPA: MFS transporter [Longimicrobiales bacterium]|nr:MFS transporter [Longimicrobiales bacterium]